MQSVKNEDDMKQVGRLIGERLRGGEIIELIGDVGAGKTTLTKGIGAGMEVDDDVQSPSFTLSRVYGARDGLELHHYDLYRLSDAGVLGYEFAESISDPRVVTVVEWAETLHDTLPKERAVIQIFYQPHDEGRRVKISWPKKWDYMEQVV